LMLEDNKGDGNHSEVCFPHNEVSFDWLPSSLDVGCRPWLPPLSSCIVVLVASFVDRWFVVLCAMGLTWVSNRCRQHPQCRFSHFWSYGVLNSLLFGRTATFSIILICCWLWENCHQLTVAHLLTLQYPGFPSVWFPVHFGPRDLWVPLSRGLLVCLIGAIKLNVAVVSVETCGGGVPSSPGTVPPAIVYRY
jgi:hypothetical protein